MVKDYKHSKGSLSSQATADVDPAAFYDDVLHLMPEDGIFIDAGGGAGRDAQFMQQKAGPHSAVFNIDPDPARYDDAKDLYPGRVALAQNREDFIQADKENQVVHIIDGIDCLEKFNSVTGGKQGDFVLCNAVMMFIPLEKHQRAIENLFRLTREFGACVLRYRTENLKADMVEIDHDTLTAQCAKAGFNVQRTPPLPDPLGRNHVWHQLILKKS